MFETFLGLFRRGVPDSGVHLVGLLAEFTSEFVEGILEGAILDRRFGVVNATLPAEINESIKNLRVKAELLNLVDGGNAVTNDDGLG